MRSEDKHRAFMELLDPELSAVMEAAVEDRLNRECTDPLTPDEYLQWITAMSQFIPKTDFVPMEGNDILL
jgi:hypothetical protein